MKEFKFLFIVLLALGFSQGQQESLTDQSSSNFQENNIDVVAASSVVVSNVQNIDDAVAIENKKIRGLIRLPLVRTKRSCSLDHKHIQYKCSPLKRSKRAIRSATETLYDQNWGEFWMGAITIGTPGQTLYVDFDTGSPDLWVPGTACRQKHQCGGNHTFNPSSSSTFKAWNKGFYISYGDGSNANGTWGNDTVNIAGIAVTGQPFAIVNTASGFNTSTSDGLLGLSYQTIASIGENPVVWSMYLAGLLSQPIFSFWFGPVSTGSDTGELIIGGLDSTKYTGCITYASVNILGYWEFGADSLILSTGSNSVTIATFFNAILDTGTTVALTAPTVYFNNIIAALGGTYDATIGLYTVNCQTKPLSAFPNIVIVISGVQFTLSPLMYILILGGPSTYKCVVMIEPMDSSSFNPIWILGDYFLRRYYSIFDMQNNRIGLALSTSYSSLQTVPSTLFQSTTTRFPTTTIKTTTATGTLPQQCRTYTTISDTTRLATAVGGNLCDTQFNSINTNSPSYVRFTAPGGTQLATSSVNSGLGNRCGTQGAGWTNTTYPTVVGQTVNAFVCFAYNGTSCFGYVYWIPITNCNGFYVQGLYYPGGCNYRYCTQ